MNIRERYNIEETLHSFSLNPQKPSLDQSWWFLAGITAGVIALLLFFNDLGEEMRWVIGIFLVYFLIHFLYDIQIASKIRFTFDARNNAVYKTSPLISKKKIMNLDEAIIFVQSEMGSWHYALGAKKSQFVKNYRISEGFSSGRKSDERQDAYENLILVKIGKLQENVNSNRNN
ncbi:hypothetical protein [Flavobacterium ginsenosidimutans]|uniref:hypothetical protein n=1 Tax=Flavobacterium ginsenosidimutans TaxID=687844 RepID=UPI000DAEE228|nr:hypothetical protein [Flavobacterium ginsenosidimutans]KAF2338890.1 hypothetical protein DM444_00655 [Flavobacterium ginsenosidimutans]